MPDQDQDARLDGIVSALREVMPEAASGTQPAATHPVPGSYSVERENAARRAEPAAVRPGSPVQRDRGKAQPSWGTVLATTMRLWLRRRLANPRWRAWFVILLAAVVFGVAAVPLILSRGILRHSHDVTGQGSGAQAGRGSAVLGAEVTRRRAAEWVVQQVNADAVVACDPAMCGALQSAGVAAGRLIVLRPGQADPLGSDILVATAAVRSQFGSRLTSVYSPVAVAGFGSGAAAIQVRVVAPDGSAAYLSELAADVRARRLAGGEIVHNSAIQTSPAARSELISGRVDPRLLETLVALAHIRPVDIIGFGASPASGISAGVPMRFAEIAGGASGNGHATSIQALHAFLSAQRPPYRPSWMTTVRAGSRTVLGVEYPAPSPLGLLGSHG